MAKTEFWLRSTVSLSCLFIFDTTARVRFHQNKCTTQVETIQLINILASPSMFERLKLQFFCHFNGSPLRLRPDACGIVSNPCVCVIVSSGPRGRWCNSRPSNTPKHRHTHTRLPPVSTPSRHFRLYLRSILMFTHPHTSVTHSPAVFLPTHLLYLFFYPPPLLCSPCQLNVSVEHSAAALCSICYCG